MYHAYIFFRHIPDKVKYLGGFYGFDVSKDKAHEAAVEEAGDIIVLGDIDGIPVGFRIEPNSQQLIEVDLTWGYYNYYRERVEADLQIRKKIFNGNLKNNIDNQ